MPVPPPSAPSPDSPRPMEDWFQTPVPQSPGPSQSQDGAPSDPPWFSSPTPEEALLPDEKAASWFQSALSPRNDSPSSPPASVLPLQSDGADALSNQLAQAARRELGEVSARTPSWEFSPQPGFRSSGELVPDPSPANSPDSDSGSPPQKTPAFSPFRPESASPPDGSFSSFPPSPALSSGFVSSEPSAAPDPASPSSLPPGGLADSLLASARSSLSVDQTALVLAGERFVPAGETARPSRPVSGSGSGAGGLSAELSAALQKTAVPTGSAALYERVSQGLTRSLEPERQQFTLNLPDSAGGSFGQAKSLDNLFRRDARRYDGSLTLF